MQDLLMELEHPEEKYIEFSGEILEVGDSGIYTISVNGEEIEPDSRNNIEIPVDKKIGEYLQRNLGNGLKLDGSILSVDTANAVEQDNTKPVTSAAVHVELGNIDAILKAI